MAGQPIKAGRCLHAALCAVSVFIGLGWSVGFGQYPPGGPMPGADGRQPPAYGPPAPMPGAVPPGAMPPGAVPAEEVVVDVRIEGNRTVTLDKILHKIRTRVGRPFIEEQVQQDVRELSKMGVFVFVRPLIQRLPAGVVVKFQVAERPLLQEVIIVGNDTYLTSVLKKEAELKAGDAADPFAVENGRRKIQEYYEKKGFEKVRVTVLEGNKAGDLRAVFMVNEGPQQRVFEVNFVGNHFVSGARLKTIVQSHPPYLYLFSGEVDRKQIDEDVAKLTAYYRDFGFFHATVGRTLEFNEKQSWATITFVVDEGQRYSVRNVSFLGNKKIDNDRLAGDLKLVSGQVFDKNQQNLDLLKLRDEYGGDGYVFSKVDADIRFLDTPGDFDKVDIVYNIDEGSRYKFGRINIEIKGENPHTQITTVLNRLSFKPGDIVDTREIANSERRLKAAQLYKVEPQKGIEPKIVYSPPQLEDKDTQLASQRRTSYYRVSSDTSRLPPLPPGERYIDVTVRAEDLQPEPPATPQNATYAPPSYPQPTFQGQTYQPSPYVAPSAPVQAYPAPASVPQGQQGAVRWESRYEPDVWAQPQPQQQGQSWPAAATGNDGSYGAQPQQTYPAPQPGYPVQQPSYVAQQQNYPAQQNYTAQQPTYLAQQPNYLGQQPSYPAGQPNYTAPQPTYPAAQPNYVTQQPAPGAGPLYYNPPPAAAPPGYAPRNGPAPADGQGLYAPAGPATSRSASQVAASGDVYNNPEPTMVPSATGDPLIDLPVRISPEETQTGRLMFGVGVNSDAGLVGNITVDEQNFDWRQFPTSWEDIVEGRAFRGAGEHFRLELVPGTQVQRYMVSFTEPYLNNQPVSMDMSGFYYQRIYPEWFESRAGGTIGFGYQFTHDLTGFFRFGGQNVDIRNPEFPVPSLEEVIGHNQLFTGTLGLKHDTRDSPFLASEGHLFSASFDETFGTFQYPRASLEFTQFFRIFQRADRSGKHVLSFSVKAGYSGDNTPIFEKYYDGGFSSIRGFAFRGVTPRDPVYQMGVGGDFTTTATAQYMFPITADDMLKGVVFVDAGTVEPRISDWVDKVRVAPGFGLRISIPMMGPAPIALDFAFPVSQQNGDQTQLFSFFVGFNH